MRSRKHVYSNSPDLTPHCRSDTFLPYPTGWEKISSAAAHLLTEHRNSYQPDCFPPTNPLVPAPEGNGFASVVRAEKVGAGGEKLVPLSLSLAYFSP